MCGIAGIVSDKIKNDNVLDSMLDSLCHRGPDGIGKLSMNNVRLGMTRLSIIDLETGWQPIYNEDKSLAIICNGEIYNYPELRNDLISKGHTFRTKSDIETIIHLYEDYRFDCVKYLRGMFAFVIYDIKNKILFAARDRLGEKPFYYFVDKDSFIFASELRTLLKSNLQKFTIDRNSLYQYLFYDYVVEPNTIIREIKKLNSGFFLIYDIKEKEVHSERYWSLLDSKPILGNPEQIIREAVLDSMRVTLKSDVPIGIALSGGIDSSLIAILIQNEYKDQLNTFSVGYEGRPQTDERKYAQELSKKLNIPFNEIELSNEDIVRQFQELVYLRDEPIADISGSGYYAVSKTAHENGYKVLLQGQGADELFWGYPIVRKAARFSSIIFNSKNNIPKLLASFFNGLKQRRNGIGLKEFIKDHITCARKSVSFNSDQLCLFDIWPGFNEAINDIKYFKTSFLDDVDSEIPYNLFKKKHHEKDIGVFLTEIIANTYLRENGITQGDRLSMANSVEMRLPFVDYKLFEIVIGLRKNFDDYNYPAKYWLVNAFKDVLPSEISQRKKRGFEPPVLLWQKLIILKYKDYLYDGFFIGNNYIDKILIDKKIHNLINYDIPSSMLFRLIVFEMWFSRIQNNFGIQ